MATTTSCGIALVERNGIAGEPLRVGDQDVGTGEQRVELVVNAGSVPERRGCFDDRAVAEVEELEERAATVGGVRVGPRPVPLVGPAAERIAVGPFHLDHVGSGVTEELGAVPPGIPEEQSTTCRSVSRSIRSNLPGTPARGLGRPR